MSSKENKHLLACVVFLVVVLFNSCIMETRKKEVVLYDTYCASCHVAPDINSLPKTIWKEAVLPAMGARMGIWEMENHPYHNLPFHEQAAILKTGIYPEKPMISSEDWEVLSNYIISLAPDTLPKAPLATANLTHQFKEVPIDLKDNISGNITYMGYHAHNGHILLGSNRGTLSAYDPKSGETSDLGNYRSPISDITTVGDSTFITAMGMLLPSEIANGNVLVHDGQGRRNLLAPLHRPVHTLVQDLDGNGSNEYVVSEFGDLAGILSLWSKNEDGSLTPKTLLAQPGTIRTMARDMDQDGHLDLVALTSQGDESITILYQKEPLKFTAEKAIRFSPVYGSSWFELVDYDDDGDQDIITVHGDNADESYVQKPYHGMRIHLNDGNNEFTEVFFYPLNGATRVVAEDFDADGDTDMALLATFPDYENAPQRAFVYLENINATAHTFKTHIMENALANRWFLMDAADMDGDGDTDIVLSGFNQAFTPVPEQLQEEWDQGRTDLMLLENTLK